MNCMKAKGLTAYMEGRLPHLESVEFEKHVQDCPDCQEQLELWINQHEDFDDMGQMEPIDEGFTQQILDKLTPYLPEESDSAEPAAKGRRRIDWKTWRKRSLTIMKITTVAAVGLAVVISLGTYVSPTFADYVKSFFNSTEKIDPGMKNAYREGFVKPLGLSVTDQGITLEVKEVLADTLRIAVICEALDQDGRPIDLESYRDLQFIIKDTSGNPLIDPSMGGWRNSKKGEYLMVERELTESIKDEQTLPDEVTVELSWTKIGDTSGNWVVDVPIDMVKAKEATKTININKKYTTPQGLMIDLKRMDLAPSLTLLSLGTGLEPEAYRKKKEIIAANGLKEELKQGEPRLPFLLGYKIQEYRLAYELLDQQGAVVAAWDEINDKSLSIQKNMIPNGMNGLGDEAGMKWWHSFVPFTERPEQLKFKLYAVYSNELADFSMKLNLADLNSDKVEAENNGNKLTFSGFYSKEGEKGVVLEGAPVTGKSGVISVQGELAKGTVGLDVWKAVDENGQEYDVRFEKKSAMDENGKVTFQGNLIIDQPLQQPKELTISYHIAEIQHRDVDWEVPIYLNPSAADVTDVTVDDDAKEQDKDTKETQTAVKPQPEPEKNSEPEQQQPVQPKPEPEKQAAPQSQTPAKPEPESKPPVKTQTEQPAKSEPEPQQPANSQTESKPEAKPVNAEDEAAKKAFNIAVNFETRYISIKDLKKRYDIDFIVHNAKKDKYGVYERAFYDLKNQQVLYVVKFVDNEPRTMFASESLSFIELSDGLYVGLESLKKLGIVK
ncbi:DUF4179 domain-containing protein [Paenibacillus thalictri]|uniref:Anti-sigma-W factor RsiW n=1 Tax=Paenibacillus thalictri TaxID=2527873 RepID=A0A4V2J3I6_9BACL|nr:DUF4179 domain-containing protein [Paenibacillus thalictri]TBL72651.1 DUF4179 domain-containing protein [Paenibacillus thalictri]